MPTPDGPSILTSPPASLPDPTEKARVVLPPSQPPYRTPGIVQPMRSARRVAPSGPAASKPAASEPAASEPAASKPAVARFGDRAGEHLAMRRGRYRAWSHVVVAYLLESVLLGIPVVRLSYALYPFASDDMTPAWIGLLAGAVLAWFVFRDRWRCIEAYASRFCSGLVRLSALYVPLIALIYANMRGLAKRRERLE